MLANCESSSTAMLGAIVILLVILTRGECAANKMILPYHVRTVNNVGCNFWSNATQNQARILAITDVEQWLSIASSYLKDHRAHYAVA